MGVRKPIELGAIFGKLTVIGSPEPIQLSATKRMFEVRVRCECGSEKVLSEYALRGGDAKSCGCGKREMLGNRNRKHGMYKTRTYRIWRKMHDRCTYACETRWVDYGGRGITYCERWKNFESFYADMGEAPEGMSLDRVDSDGNYEPSNCRWSSSKEQARNTRRNVMVSVDGTEMYLTDAFPLLPISIPTVYSWMRNNKATHQQAFDHFLTTYKRKAA